MPDTENRHYTVASLLRFDLYTGLIITLMLFFQFTSIYTASHFESILTPPRSTSTAQTTNVFLGAGYILRIIIFAAVLIIGWRLYKRLPDKYKTHVRTLFQFGVVGGLLWLSSLVDLLPTTAITITTVYLTYKLLTYYNLWWVGHNLLGILLGVLAVGTLAHQFAPVIVIGFLLILLTLDHISVEQTGHMDDIVAASSHLNLPNYLVFPNSTQLNMTRLKNTLSGATDNIPDSVNSIIGVGDLIFPSLLATSAAVTLADPTHTIVLCTIAGACTSIPFLSHSLHKSGDLPALPWLNTGSLAGFAVGVLITPTSILAALGL